MLILFWPIGMVFLFSFACFRVTFTSSGHRAPQGESASGISSNLLYAGTKIYFIDLISHSDVYIEKREGFCGLERSIEKKGRLLRYGEIHASNFRIFYY